MLRFALIVAAAAGLPACSDDAPSDPPWQLVQEDLPGALLSVWGTSSTDVWAVGGDARDGTGPMVLHYDGSAWERIETGQSSGALWWVFGFAGGPIYMGGDGGIILRYEAGEFSPMTTPGTDRVFGIWGASPDDVWAVGGASDTGGGFAWRLQGGAWVDEPSLPAEIPTSAAIWKVYGTATDDAWLVGSNGVSLRWDGSTLTPGDTGVGTSLFTVHEHEGRYAAVGGLVNGIVVEYDGEQWHDVTPSTVLPGLSGVCLGSGGSGFAVGTFGTVYSRGGSGWAEEELGFYLDQNLHAVWIDDIGGVWAVGGQTASSLTEGVLIHRGQMLPTGVP